MNQRRPPDACVPLDPAVSERAAIESSLDALAALFDGAAGPRSALLVVSPDAGGASALRFWSEARRTGLAMANPEMFPWCLANAPCGALARRFGIGGPNVTSLGDDDEALQAAWDSAERWLAHGLIDLAFVVVLRMSAAAGAAPELRAWRLTAPR
jgi:3-oxoacyl-(acyl-carrier-protein) synthase